MRTYRLFSEFDWSTSPLGPPEAWPQSLRIATDICMASRFPMFVWWGPDLINIYNEAHSVMLGQHHPHAFGRPAREAWGADWNKLRGDLDEVLQHGEATWHAHTRVKTDRTGEVEDAWFTWSLSPIYDRDRIGGLFCACADETADVLATTHLETMLHNGDVGTFSLDLRTGHLDGGSARMHPADAHRVEEAITHSHDTGAPFDPTYRVLRDDGSVRWMANRGRVRTDASGAPISIDGVALDITDMHIAEERRRESEERLVFATRAAELGIIEWNAVADTCMWENQRTYEIFGRDVDDGPMNRRQICESGMVHPDDAPKFELALRAAASQGGQFKYVCRIQRQGDFVWRWIELAGGLKTSADGKPLKLVTVVADITERKNHLDSERAARNEAERVSRMKDDFLATLSHELRTPLTAILGWSDLLQRGSLDEAAARTAIATIDRNARVQTRLIEDLLEMSRIISGKTRLELQPVDLSDIVDAAIATAQPTAMSKRVGLSKVTVANDVRVSGDSARLQQIVSNLLSNALKFTPGGGRIDVRVSREGNDAVLEVTDTGAGIAPSFVPHVFDRFAQGDSALTRRHGGLGLGLSIVKQLVEMHDGSVVAESAGIGRGATFVVRVPLLSHEVSAETSPPTRDTDLSGLKVLVVDDEADTRELVKHILEQRNAAVVTAGSAAAGLEMLERHRPDVVLSDIGMPDVDGYDFIRQVRALGVERGGSVPAIAVTAFARSEDRERALSAGYQTHLAKPMQIPDLVHAIASIACGARIDRAT